MAKKTVNTAIEEILVSNSDFEYAHLVKFERPFAPDSVTDEFRTNANRYAYYTDGPRDISFDDGSTDQDGNSNGSQVYRANRILNVGSYSETTTPRATNMSLTFAGEHLGTSIVLQGTFTSATFTATTEIYKGEPVDFVEEGFREGDRIKFTKSSGNFSTGVSTVTYIITGFTTNNTVITLDTTGNDTDDTTTYPTDSNIQVTLSLESDELNAVTNERLVSTLTNPSFLNREVFIHKVFIDPETGDLAGNSSILIFRGIIAKCNLSEAETSSRVKWSLSSHWADFNEINGRITSDEIHRALDGNSRAQPNMAIRPEYATDLGFMHSETTLNQIAIYQTTETRTVMKSKKRGGVAGLLGGKKYYTVEEQYQVDNEVDLSVNLQGKYLPIVYGVQRINGIPIFADTAANNSKEVYVLYAISEGEIQGLYNLYIDGVPLICSDKADFDVRNSSTGTDKDNSQLQCYGRADRGDTLGGQSDQSSGSNLLAQISSLESRIESLENDYYSDVRDSEVSEEIRELEAELQVLETRYQSLQAGDALSVVANSDARGMYHGQTGSITHPYRMEFHFFSGKPNQKASNLLVTKANANGFKRQADYYEGTLPYWSPSHRLLDTAYVVTTLTINEDQTTVPDIEYVVKGKLTECFNYDNTYEPALSFSDVHTNFLEGDTVNVQRSTDGNSYSNTTGVGDSNENFKILDKYLWTGADGTAFYRFRLDRRPDLDYTDGVPSYPYLRLRQIGGQNYWHMRTYNAKVLENALLNLVKVNPTSVTDSNGTLQMTFSTTDANTLKSGYIYSAVSGLMDYQVFVKNSTFLQGLKSSALVGSWSGNTLTFNGLTGYGDIANIGSNLTQIEVFRATVFTLTNAVIQNLSNSSDLVGETITLNETGESRKITSFSPLTNTINIESPFFTLTEQRFDDGLSYTISSTKGDRRASNNPAIQLLDYITDKGYGKDLKIEEDINLESFISSARLCDTRSDITFSLTSEVSVNVGDVYRLTDDATSSGNHVASGKILSTQVIDGKTSITLTDVSGKFTRKYYNYISYKEGDIVYTTDNNFYRVGSTGTGLRATKPTHTVGVNGGWTYISSNILLHKESGSGLNSLLIDGQREITYSLYDADFIKYWRYLGWENHDQMWVTRHQTNFIIDTTKSVFSNVNAFLSHFNGILSYSNGKYTLDVETQVNTPQIENTFNSVTYDENVNPEYIDNTDIIGSITLNDDSSRNAKNTIKASIFDPQNNWSTRAVSFFNSDFVKADRGLVRTGSYTVTGITNYYNARIGVEKELIQSRFSKEISFTVGQKGLLLKAGAVIAVTYDPFKFDKKLFRIENATFNPNCTVSIKAREYDDSIYVISKQRASRIRQEASTQSAALSAPGAPTNLSATSDKPGVVILSWNNASNFNEPTDSTQIWVSDDNNRANAEKVATLDDTVSFRYSIASAVNRFFWIRHVRRSTSTADNSIKQLVSAYHPTGATSGVSGISKLLSPQLDVDVSSIQIKFNDSGVLTPTGTAQDVKLTATLRNITPDSNGVIFTLVNTDQTSQSDVQFTNGSTTLTDTSSPYEATVDASSASNATTNKFVKVTTTDLLGETFTELVPISVTKDGSSGSTGIAAAAVKLEPSSSVITYGANAPDTEDPETTITFTTDLQGNTGDSTSAFSSTPYYEFLIDGTTSGSISTTSTFTLPDSSEPADGETVEVKVKVRDGSTSGTVKATDSVTIFGIKSGSDSTTAFLTNSAHVVSTASDGTGASFTGAGGTFKVLIGSTDRTTNCTYAVSSESGVDVSINSATGVYSVNSMSADFGTAVFRVTIPSSVSPTGNQFTIDQTYTISKSKAGVNGDPGSPGAAGLRTIQGYLFYEKTTSGAPSAPSGNTYTFSTGVVSGSGINDSGTTNVWKNSPNTQDATSTNTFYTVRYYGTESAANSSTITVAYTNVVQQTSFTGVVTFSGGTFSEVGGSGITTIDGDNITTGQIQSSVTSETSTYTSAGALFDLTNAEIKTPYFYSTNSGAGFKGTVTIGSTDLDATNTLNSNTSKTDVGLGNVNNPGSSTTPIGSGDVNGNVTSISGGVISTGVINLATAAGMAIRAGKSSSTDTTTGFYLGNDSGGTTPKFSIGSSTKFLKWDGSELSVNGNTVTGGGLSLTSGSTLPRIRYVDGSAGSTLEMVVGTDTDDDFLLSTGATVPAYTNGVLNNASSIRGFAIYGTGSAEFYASRVNPGSTNTIALGDISVSQVWKQVDIGTGGLYLTSGTPGGTTNRLYNNSGTLFWNGSQLATGGGANNSTITLTGQGGIRIGSEINPTTTSEAFTLNQSGAENIRIRLNDSGVTAGTYGSTTVVPQIAVDAQGRITSVSNQSINFSGVSAGTGIDVSGNTVTLDLTEVGFGGGANRLITDDGDGTVTSESNLTFNGSSLSITGSVVASGDVTAFSDERLKKDIKTLQGSKVYEMRGVSFTKDNKKGSGVIAQELEKITPELVTTTDEGIKSVAYGNITGYLIEAIKELKQEIEELKNK